MTFLINKNSNFKKPEAGVTLLLTLLLLSAILSISFSLATVLFIQVRISGDLPHTAASLYASDGIAEQAFYNISRKVPTTSYTTQFSNNTSLRTQPIISPTSTAMFEDVVPTDGSFLNSIQNGKNKYDFCSTVATTSGCGLAKLTLAYLPTGNSSYDNLVVYLCQWDPTLSYTDNQGNLQVPCTDKTTASYWITVSNASAPYLPNDPYGTVMSPGGVTSLTWTWDRTTTTLDPNLQQELILYNTGTHPINISIETWDVNGNPTGIPLLGSTSATVTTQNGQSARRIQVTVPNNPGH